MNPDQAHTFEIALSSYRAGDRSTARRMVHELLAEDERMLEAWLLLSYVEEHWYDQMQCARNALVCDPDSIDAEIRIETLKSERLPDLYMPRTHSVIPALKEDHEKAVEAYIRYSVLEPELDPLDDPWQCPYCGVPNAQENKVCVACKQSLMFRPPKEKKAVPALRSATAASIGLLVMVLLQLLPILLWPAYQGRSSNVYLEIAVNTMLDQPAVKFIVGNFTQTLNETIYVVLYGAGLLRLSLLFLTIAGIQFRLIPAYYIGLGLFGFEVFIGLITIAMGWTGLIPGVAGIMLALMSVFFLAASSVNFRVHYQRYAVRPNGKLKSGHALWEEGKRYQKQGLWAMAVCQYRAAVSAAPNRAHHYKSLGIGYNKLGRTERALPVLEQALLLDPTDSETMVLVKRLQSLKGAAQARPKPAKEGEQTAHE